MKRGLMVLSALAIACGACGSHEDDLADAGQSAVDGSVSDGTDDAAGGEFRVGGSVSGLRGSLILELNGAVEATVTADGPFHFAGGLDAGDDYEVIIAHAPDIQTCTIEANSGKVASGDVEDIAVRCTTKLFWTLDDGSHGFEPWMSDGTADGTVLIKDIYPGSNESMGLASANSFSDPLPNGLVVFAATSSASNPGVWVTDGSPGGTSPIAGSPMWPDEFVEMNGVVYFAGNGAGGYELWRTDGTETGTFVVKQIGPGPYDGNPVDLTIVGDTLYFAADDQEHGRELWKSDGTADGTLLVKDIHPAGSSLPAQFHVVGSTLYMWADDGTSGTELWKSDGTEAGTVLVKDIRPGAESSYPTYMASLGDQILFSAADQQSDAELWTSDGTPEGTVQVLEINPTGPSTPQFLIPHQGAVYFRARGDSGLQQLWKTNGTAAGTTEIVINASDHGAPSHFSIAGNILFFRATDSELGEELWITDGSVDGTDLVKDIRPGASSSEPLKMRRYGHRLFFFANDGSTGIELYETDGTGDGTSQVKDINPTGDSTTWL